MNLLVPLGALLETCSVTLAAAEVGLSQSAMSHALARLRKVMGDELLVRTGNVMHLTARAEELVPLVRRVLEQSSQILHPNTFNPATDRRIVTFAMTTSIAFVFGPLLMRAFATHAPHVVLRLQTTGVQQETVFRERGVDAVLLSQGSASPLSRGFTSPYPSERVFDDRWVVLASAELRDDRSALELIAQEPHVIYDAGDGAGSSMRAYEILDAHSIDYEVRAHVADNLLIPRLLDAAPSVALQRFQVGVEFARSHGLRVEEFPFGISDLGVDLVWNPWVADFAFRDWLRDLVLAAAEPLRERAL